MELKLTREEFWKYINEARKKSPDDFSVIVYLTQQLEKKSNEEIFSFGIILDEIMLESYKEKLWCASYLVNGESSEESFDFFRLWLISKGEKVYNDVMKNHDNLIKYIGNPEDEDFVEDFYENEDFFFIAVDAYGKKNNIEGFEDIFEQYLDEFDLYKEKLKYVDVDYPKLKFTWNEKVPKSMRKICPKLFNRLYIGDEVDK